jgi:hypothetical protein
MFGLLHERVATAMCTAHEILDCSVMTGTQRDLFTIASERLVQA